MNPKRRIVHLIISLNSGGCENMLLRTLPHLTTDFVITVVTLKEPGQLAQSMIGQGIEVVNVNWQGFFDFAGLRRLKLIIQELKPTLIITYLFHADMIGRLYLQSRLAVPIMPFLRTTHNYPRYWPALVLEWLTKGTVRHYLACSEAVKQYYHQVIGVPERKITVIHNGIDADRFETANGQVVLQELQLPSKRLVFTCVANLARNKGHRYLFEAFESTFAGHPEAILLVVGAGRQESNLKAQVSKYQSRDNIYFLGRRDDIPKLLAITDIFVLPTLFEGMSNALLEALAAKLAVITTDIPQNKTVITDGQTGLLVPVRDAKKLASAMLALANDPNRRKDFSQNASKLVRTDFDLDTIVKQWKEVLNRYAKKS